MIEWSKDSVKNIGKISQDEGAAQSKWLKIDYLKKIWFNKKTYILRTW